jgi:hypothetical protein
MAAALFGTATLARAESGAFIGGGRLAYNYSNIYYDYGRYSYRYSNGGNGVEAGALGRLAIVEGQMGIHIGVNYIYREPFYVYSRYYYYDEWASEHVVSVPILFEINPFVTGGLNSRYYEMIFIQIGPQIDYGLRFTQDVSFPWDRKKSGNIDVGLVIGAVGYFNSYCSLDLRYYYAFTGFAANDQRSFLYSGSLGLSIYL